MQPTFDVHGEREKRKKKEEANKSYAETIHTLYALHGTGEVQRNVVCLAHSFLFVIAATSFYLFVLDFFLFVFLFALQNSFLRSSSTVVKTKSK